MQEFERELVRRNLAARATWSGYCERFKNGPADAASLWDNTGGINLTLADWKKFEASHPALYHVLRTEGIIEASHSHGGFYFLADPCMYVRAPCSLRRRRRIDSRLKSTLTALPSSLTLADMEFWEWAGILAALELVRTDLCSILWHELKPHAPSGRRTQSIEVTEALVWLSRIMFQLLPPLFHSSDPAREVDMRQSFICPSPIQNSQSSDRQDENLIRSRRASDAVLSVWASVRRLIACDDAFASPCWVFGNAFGAIDLAFDVAEALRSLGVAKVTSSLCTVRAGGSEGSHDSDFVLWPDAEPEPRSIIFCDDSITTGSTYSKFKEACRERYPDARLHPFFLSFDLHPPFEDESGAKVRFELANCATVRAPWSPGFGTRPTRVNTIDDLVDTMLASSDEQLRWIGKTQLRTLYRLNP